MCILNNNITKIKVLIQYFFNYKNEFDFFSFEGEKYLSYEYILKNNIKTFFKFLKF